MTKKNELTTKTSTDVAIPQHLSEWGAPPQLSTKDTTIPKIMLIQPMSKKATDGQGAFGELRDSVTNHLYGSFTKSMEFVPFYFQALWVESEYVKEKNDFVYKRTVPVTPENDSAPYEEGLVKRTRSLNFYILTPEEIAEGRAIPKILTFRVTSLRGGRKLATQMFVSNHAAGLSPAGMVMKLTVKKDSNDKGTFATMDVEQVRASTEKEVAVALQWFKTVKQGANIKVDDSDLHEAPREVDVVGEPGQF
jgi:hypothetical protein